MRNCLSYMGILAVIFVNVTGLVGCAGRETSPKAPIADRFVELPAPTPADTDAASQNVKDAMAQWYATWKAKIKADACKP